MPNVGLHREDERVVLAAVNESHGNVASTAALRGTEPMHSVDNLHRGPMHDDRRQLVVSLRQCLDVLGALTSPSRREGAREFADRNPGIVDVVS